MAPSISNPASPTNGAKRSVQKYLTNCKSLYSCIYCRTHLANHDELVSRSFQGNHGRAYLFNSVINISCGPAVQRELNTGSHAVADIFCSNCETTLGWKYEKAYVQTQKYKEGKYIIELAHVVRENRHLELDRSESLNIKRGNLTSNSNVTKNSSSSSSRPNSLSTSSASSESYKGNEEYDYDDSSDELMLDLYDDLCPDRSGCSNNLSSSQRSRLRRSIYLDSTPYDWKYSSASYNSGQSTRESIDKEASSSPPSTSTGQDPEVRKRIHINSCSDEGIEPDGFLSGPDDEEHDTQFSFEAESPPINHNTGNKSNTQTSKLCDGNNYKDNNFGANESGEIDKSGNRDSNNVDSESQNVQVSNKTSENSAAISTNDRHEQESATGPSEDLRRNPSVSLVDDEEFYDCCTDHSISDLALLEIDSQQTLKHLAQQMD